MVMEETFAQIAGAAQHSIENVDVSITEGGSIVGQGVSASGDAVRVCGGNLDRILKSFGGIEGGDMTIGGKAKRAVKKASRYGGMMKSEIEGGISALSEISGGQEHAETLSALGGKVDNFVETMGGFESAISQLDASPASNAKSAGMLSLALTGINKLGGLSKDVAGALERANQFIQAETFADGGDVDGGDMATSKTHQLAERLAVSREELKDIINKFIHAFASGVNDLVSSTNDMVTDFGKKIGYDEHTITFLDSFTRLNEYISGDRKAKIYQHLLELNIDQIDSKEIKDRFLSLLRVLADNAEGMDSSSSTKGFAQHCRTIVTTVNKYCDMVKSFRDVMKKQGGSTETMNELFSVDASKIQINGLLAPLENLSTVIKKLKFFRNIAVFRSNLQQTNKELATYTKDYPKSVGKAIGQAITKIQTEYAEIISQISDNKTGMGLEIDMYNASREDGQKISKEKLKKMYKWQCDARIGLYKTVEAIDLYLLHFTESVTQNPDAVADLHKLLTATKIISKWYDDKAGNSLIRMFESFANGADDARIEADQFITDYDNINNQTPAGTAGTTASWDLLTSKLSGDRAEKVYERCKRAVEGVVVLKNIISYFITISEKYGDFKSEKNIYMAPSNIYKNLVNYIWVSSINLNTTGTEILTDSNEVKRIMTYEDAKVELAKIDSSVDPETFGINFGRHSMDKLRIMKSHQEFLRLRDFTAQLDDDSSLDRIKQYVVSTFARLGKTEYIFYMIQFGVYDLTQMDRQMIERFLGHLRLVQSNAANPRGNQPMFMIRGFTLTGDGKGINDTTFRPIREADKAPFAAAISAIPKTQRNDKIEIRIVSNLINADGSPVPGEIKVKLYNLEQFKAMTKYNKDQPNDPMCIHNLLAFTDPMVTPGQPRSMKLQRSGFLHGFLRGITGNNQKTVSVSYAARAMATLHYVVMEMVRRYKNSHQNSIFAIDDTYFMLTMKAIAGKIMAVTGINRLLKDPSQYNNIITKNEARLIMGGAEGDAEIIEEAVELYVRLPLLVEFYRSIFDNGNRDYINESISEPLDEERVAFVPEVGNVWSGLIINIFEKSKHIANGIYTFENMKKIVAEINTIYKHYKSAAKQDELVRHIILELIAEINRRYGVIKRQELLQYYKVMNATKRANLTEFSESNYSTNDLDILNESLEFEEKSPSAEFVKLQDTLKDASVSMDTKINRLTDYKILKDFRERIDAALTSQEDSVRSNGAGSEFLSIVDRIRHLKRAIAAAPSRQDKYDMIIKAIQESDAINLSSNEVFTCFHEFVIMPLRTAYQMYYGLRNFMTTLYAILNAHDFGATNPLAQYRVKNSSGVEDSLDNVIRAYVGANIATVKFSFGNGLLISGRDSLLNSGTGSIDANLTQVGLLNTLVQFASNSGDLVKINISTTKQITIDFSEYQKVSEYLVANVKYMIDKFTGLVPTSLIEKATSSVDEGGVYWLEKQYINGMFNKMNKNEKDRGVACLDTVNLVMPIVSDIIYSHQLSADNLVSKVFLHANNNALKIVNSQNAVPVIRDAFMKYSDKSKMYIHINNQDTYISTLLFNASQTGFYATQRNFGLLQQFNRLIATYLHDMYDSQSRKIYSKLFAQFAGSALMDALNGQSYPDFTIQDPTGPFPPDALNNFTDRNLFGVCESNVVLSSTLAYAMKTLLNRVHPTTGMKVHELTALSDVSPHILEKYRMALPMHIRMFQLFINKCKLHRKIIGKMTVVSAAPGAAAPITNSVALVNGLGDQRIATCVKEYENDTYQQFANPATLINQDRAQAVVAQQLDEIVNGMTSLLQDAKAVYAELLETSSSVALYFDLKKDFTKNYMASVKELPFAPLSILSMGYASNPLPPMMPLLKASPFYTTTDVANNKFLYGCQSLIANEFKLSTSTIPYLKKLVDGFNGYATSANSIPEKKFNDMLSYVGKAVNYIYDLRFFNGKAFVENDILDRVITSTKLTTIQESIDKANALSLIESVNVVDSSDQVALHVKSIAGTAASGVLGGPIFGPTVAPGVPMPNPRARVILVNIIDMNVMPINVHSLMREIPLANLYNYSMTFDQIVDGMSQIITNAEIRELLKNPYHEVKLRTDAAGDQVIRKTAGVEVKLRDLTQADSSLRFVNDILVKRVLKFNAADADGTLAAKKLVQADRLNSKVFRNLMFLTLIQYAIKEKVKTELQFINTRIVSNTAAVSDVITNATQEVLNNNNLFEF